MPVKSRPVPIADSRAAGEFSCDINEKRRGARTRHEGRNRSMDRGLRTEGQIAPSGAPATTICSNSSRLRCVTRAASARNVSTARPWLHFFVAEPAREALEIGRVLGQLGGSAIVDQPQAVFDGAQKVVGVAQLVVKLGARRFRCRRKAASASQKLGRSKSGLAGACTSKRY